MPRVNGKKFIRTSIENLQTITKANNVYNEDIMYKLTEGGVGVNWIDLFFLDKYLKHNNITQIFEIGCGTSTVFLENSDYNVETVALGYPTQSKRHGVYFVPDGRKIDFLNINLSMDSNIEKIYSLLNNKQMIIIDGDHSWKFAERYFYTILSKFKLPVFIHDYYINKDPFAGEIKFLNSNVIEKTHDLEYCTDLLDIPQIIDFTKFDNNGYKNNKFGKGTKCLMPPCSIVLKPMAEVSYE